MKKVKALLVVHEADTFHKVGTPFTMENDKEAELLAAKGVVEIIGDVKQPKAVKEPKSTVPKASKKNATKRKANEVTDGNTDLQQ